MEHIFQPCFSIYIDSGHFKVIKLNFHQIQFFDEFQSQFGLGLRHRVKFYYQMKIKRTYCIMYVKFYYVIFGIR